MLLLGVSMVVIVILVFVGMILFMKRFISGSVTSVTSHLDQLEADYAQKEEAIKRQLEEAKVKSQEIIANAQKDALQQKEALLKQAQEEKAKLLSEAHQEATEVIRQADNARVALLAELEQKINDGSLRKAAELLQSSIPEEIKAMVHAQWTQSIIDGSFENLDRLKIPEGLTEVSVVTAFPLEQGQRKALAAKLREKLGFDVKLAEQVDPKIIAGVIVSIGSLCLDGSLSFKIQEVARGQR